MTRLQAALPKAYYTDAGHWAVERDRVLAGEWFCVGRLAELGLTGPGRVAVVEVLGESLLLSRDPAGALRGHYNVCRHRGAQLVAALPGARPATLGARALRCPYHSWTYGLDGALLRAPHADGLEGFEPTRFGLHPVGAAEWAGFGFVRLTPDPAPPLAEALGGVPGRVRRYPLDALVVGRRLDYDVAANWKVLCENYNECYHCAGVHPELCRLVPAFGRGGAELDWNAGIPHREGAWTFTASGTTSRARFPELNETERVRHKGELVYPNLWLSLAADHVAAFVLHPLAADRTRMECVILVQPGEAPPDDAAAFWDLVNQQDWAVCESVQRGMSSRAYQQGWFAPMEDASLDIRRWLLPRLERE